MSRVPGSGLAATRSCPGSRQSAHLPRSAEAIRLIASQASWTAAKTSVSSLGSRECLSPGLAARAGPLASVQTGLA